ncbi:hypothetical protein EDC01DRAFT_642423 [Geopyxis carbonaria]|nr:hypothetical protein EDC01DRAFT_642423 [Geopyxis carbonaria]
MDSSAPLSRAPVSAGSAPVAVASESAAIVPASECQSMPQVRAAIDALDVEIVTLLGHRTRYIEAAARIKPSRAVVRDEWRKADVIAKALATARRSDVDVPQEVVRAVYEALVEGSIAHEFGRWDATREPQVDNEGGKEG